MLDKDYHKNGGVRAINRMIRVSPYKLNLVAASIRGLAVGEAVNRLTYTRKSVAESVLKTLNSAISNAEHNHKMDVDTLHVAHAFVGKTLVMKRMRFHARGRVGRVKKLFSRLTIIVQKRPQPSMKTQEKEKD